GGDLVPLVPHHEERVLGGELTGGVEDVPDEAAAGDRVQHLRRGGLHPRAFAGGEDDDGESTIAHANHSAGSGRIEGRPGDHRANPRGQAGVPPWCNGSTTAFGAVRSRFESWGRSRGGDGQVPAGTTEA